MPERDCSKHNKRVTVKLDELKLTRKQHPNLIAGLLRVVAEYTDGFCAVELARDDDLTASKGMGFWFSDADKQALFKKRIGIYLEEEISGALTST